MCDLESPPKHRHELPDRRPAAASPPGETMDLYTLLKCWQDNSQAGSPLEYQVRGQLARSINDKAIDITCDAPSFTH